jgi:hypothetical protein
MRNSSEYLTKCHKAKSPKPDHFAEIVCVIDKTEANAGLPCNEAWQEDEEANSKTKVTEGNFSFCRGIKEKEINFRKMHWRLHASILMPDLQTWAKSSAPSPHADPSWR